MLGIKDVVLKDLYQQPELLFGTEFVGGPIRIGVAFFTIFSRMLPHSEKMLTYIRDIVEQFRAWTQTAEGIAAIDGFLERTTTTAGRLWQVFLDLTVAIYNLFDALNKTGVTEQTLSGLENMAQKFRDITTEGTTTRLAIDEFLIKARPVIEAMNNVLAVLVETWFYVADGIVSAQDAAGNPTLVGMLDAIAEVIPIIGEWLVTTFENLGPAISDLLPSLAEVFRIFAEANTQVLSVLIELLDGLLDAFLALPQPLQDGIALFAALGGALSTLGIAAAVISGVVTKLWSLVAVLGPLAAFAAAAILIDIAVNFDYEAATEAYNAARTEGYSIGESFSQAVIAGLESAPIAGPTVEWLDKAFDAVEESQAKAEEKGGVVGGVLAEGFKNALYNALPAVGAVGRLFGTEWSDQVKATEPEAEAAGSALTEAGASGAEDNAGLMTGAGATGAANFADGVAQGVPGAEAASGELSFAATSTLQDADEQFQAGGISGAQAYAMAIEGGVPEAQAAAAFGVDQTTIEYAKMPANVSEALRGMTPEMLTQFQNAHATAANATAEFARVVRINYAAVSSNLQQVAGEGYTGRAVLLGVQ